MTVPEAKGQTRFWDREAALQRAAWGLDGVRHVLRVLALLQVVFVPEKPICMHFWRGEEEEEEGKRTATS